MRIKVESPGKIFAVRSKRVDVSTRRIDETTFEVEIKDRVRTVSVKLPYELYEKMVDHAERNEVTISEVIRKALKEFLEKNP